jgi:hypothetical protein
VYRFIFLAVDRLRRRELSVFCLSDDDALFIAGMMRGAGAIEVRRGERLTGRVSRSPA